MITKGNNQHVMPSKQGWCVVDEASLMVVRHFATQEEALSYAENIAHESEGCVLVHTTHCECTELSTVSLPQREILKTPGHLSEGRLLEEELKESDFDPFLGFDEYYFEI